jgi:hypothetical protein
MESVFHSTTFSHKRSFLILDLPSKSSFISHSILSPITNIFDSIRFLLSSHNGPFEYSRSQRFFARTKVSCRNRSHRPIGELGANWTNKCVIFSRRQVYVYPAMPDWRPVPKKTQPPTLWRPFRLSVSTAVVAALFVQQLWFIRESIGVSLYNLSIQDSQCGRVESSRVESSRVASPICFANYRRCDYRASFCFTVCRRSSDSHHENCCQPPATQVYMGEHWFSIYLEKSQEFWQFSDWEIKQWKEDRSASKISACLSEGGITQMGMISFAISVLESDFTGINCASSRLFGLSGHMIEANKCSWLVLEKCDELLGVTHLGWQIRG